MLQEKKILEKSFRMYCYEAAPIIHFRESEFFKNINYINNSENKHDAKKKIVKQHKRLLFTKRKTSLVRKRLQNKIIVISKSLKRKEKSYEQINKDEGAQRRRHRRCNT